MDRRGIRVKRTSSLWETAPMYVTDQGRFINAACEVSTTRAYPKKHCPEVVLALLVSVKMVLVASDSLGTGRDRARASSSAGPAAGH